MSGCIPENELVEAREALLEAGAEWRHHYGEVKGSMRVEIARASSCFSSAIIAYEDGDTRRAIAWLLLARARASGLIRRLEG